MPLPKPTYLPTPFSDFPFCTIDPNEARCALQDARYDHLISIWKPVNTHPAHLQITDIAGLVRGASEGAGLGNDFLSHIQQVHPPSLSLSLFALNSHT